MASAQTPSATPTQEAQAQKPDLVTRGMKRIIYRALKTILKTWQRGGTVRRSIVGFEVKTRRMALIYDPFDKKLTFYKLHNRELEQEIYVWYVPNELWDLINTFFKKVKEGDIVELVGLYYQLAEELGVEKKQESKNQENQGQGQGGQA